jgi:hypothetical protein
VLLARTLKIGFGMITARALEPLGWRIEIIISDDFPYTDFPKELQQTESFLLHYIAPFS